MSLESSKSLERLFESCFTRLSMKSLEALSSLDLDYHEVFFLVGNENKDTCSEVPYIPENCLEGRSSQDIRVELEPKE